MHLPSRCQEAAPEQVPVLTELALVLALTVVLVLEPEQVLKHNLIHSQAWEEWAA